MNEGGGGGEEERGKGRIGWENRAVKRTGFEREQRKRGKGRSEDNSVEGR